MILLPADSRFSWTVVSAESKRSRIVSEEAKYDGQSLLEAKISGLVYTLCTTRMLLQVKIMYPYDCSCYLAEPVSLTF